MTSTSTGPTSRSRSCTIKSSIPQSPSSSMNAATNNGGGSSNNSNNVMFRSQHLQFGLILIVISVLLIDGIAIVSHSNLFESISTTVGATTTTTTNRHLRQIEVTNIRTTSRETDVPPTSSEESDLRVPSASSNDVNEPKIVWLMSFPNSGTSYTSQLVRDTTYTISASNYADETPLGLEGFLEPVYEDQIQGPFWIRPEETPIEYTEPSQYILTKTHCGMRCTLCPPEKYSESSYSFRRRCSTTKWVQEQEDGTFQRVFGEYKVDRVAKAIHLIRNPFDNIVSRFHLDHDIAGRRASTFEKSRDGFRSYCHSIDTLFAANEDKVDFLDEEILDVIRQVPCHEEFIRYVEWHNLAFNTADDLRLPTHVLHYEWYTTRYDATVMDLLNFLGFDDRIGDPVPFRPSVSYDYFTEEETLALKHAYEMMSSSQTWSHISQYFHTATTTATTATTLSSKKNNYNVDTK